MYSHFTFGLSEWKHNLKKKFGLSRMSKVPSKKKNELSEKLSSLIQTKPCVIESDDDDFVTVNKIVADPSDKEYSNDELTSSKYRLINTKYLSEEDDKYSGRAVLRKTLKDYEENCEAESISNQSDSEDTNAETDSERHDVDESDVESDDDDGDDNNDECDGTYDEVGEEVDEEIDERIDKNGEFGRLHKVSSKRNLEQDKKNFNQELFSQAEKDLEKGKAIKTQLFLWDFLLECRMKFQICLVSSNQFPNHKNFKQFERNLEFQESVAQTKKSLRHLLKKLLSFQNILLSSNEDYLNSVKTLNENSTEENNSEINSDVDYENDHTNNSERTIKKGKTYDPLKQLKKLQDFSYELKKRHQDFEIYRNTTIQKWNDRTRVGLVNSKDFNAFEQSALKRIEQILLDKQRLITRTQIKRSSYHILGEPDDGGEPPKKKMLNSETDTPAIESVRNKVMINKEIFDDDDFYHQLLSELVKRKSNDINDSVLLGRQWMHLQHIRSKMKKTVDTKASKGRKVRFVVHPKLVNFMMPIDNSVYGDGSRIELINSLFGKRK